MMKYALQNSREHKLPYYYFDVNGLRDDQGKELPDSSAARAYARRLLSSGFEEADLKPGECKAWACMIRNQEGGSLVRVAMVSLVEPADQSSPYRSFQPS